MRHGGARGSPDRCPLGVILAAAGRCTYPCDGCSPLPRQPSPMRIQTLRHLAVFSLFTAALACGSDGPDAGDKGKAGDTTAAAGDSASGSAPAQARTPRQEAPEVIRGLYLNAYAAGSPNRLPRLLAMADT